MQYLAMYKNTLASFQGIQSVTMAFVACTCNILCILHQYCPMTMQHFTPISNPAM